MAQRNSSVFPFLELPYNIRNEIYQLVLKYPNLNSAFDRHKAALTEVEDKEDERLRPSCTLPRPPKPAMHTPAILMLSRQITAEALPVLRNTTFVLEEDPPRSMDLGHDMDITDFISEETLRKILYVELRLDLDGRPRLGPRTIEELLDIWTAGHSLKKLTVWAYECPWLPEGSPRHSILPAHMRHWGRGTKETSKIRNFVEAAGVALAGDLPEERLVRRPR